MFLKAIEIQGFKSFPNKARFEVNDGITGIVGPNGSGKSNIVDAIRWVLGEQSMRTLRTGKSEDIIFNGTQTRKPLGFADVTLVIDNSIGTLPINYTEVTVTRRIYRSGESEFFINKNVCRLKDINELFMGTGIGKDGYSIIGQGRIEEILSNKPDERRTIFEEATGIMKYKIRKQDAEKKLEETKTNLTRISDIISELELQIEPLKQQSEKAREYLNLKEKIKELDISLFSLNLSKYKNNLKEVDENIINLNQEITEKQREYEEKKLAKQDTQNRGTLLQEKIDGETTGISDTLNNIEKINSEINLINEKIKNNELNFERFSLEIEQYNEKIESIKQDLESKADKLAYLQNDRDSFLVDLKEKEDILSKIGANIESDEKAINDIQTLIDDYYNKVTELKTLNTNSSAIQYSGNVRKSKIDTEMSQIKVDKNANVLKGEEYSKNIVKLNQDILEKTNKINSFSFDKAELEKQISKLKAELDKANGELNIKKSKHRFLVDLENQNEGFSKSVKSVLDAWKANSLKGIHGALASLISVPKEYETAIEISLGFTLQNIVTDNENDAKNAIEFLKRNRLGRATFLPISTYNAKASEPIGNVDTYTGFIGMANKLIKYDDKYGKIINSLLGKTIIVDNIDNGIAISKKVKYGFKIVTIEGDVINPYGSMSGGSITQKSGGILSRSREINDIKLEIEELQDNISAVSKKLEDATNKYNGLDEEYSKMNSELHELQISLIKEQEQFTSNKNLIELLDQKITDLTNEKNGIIASETELCNTIEENNKKIAEYEINIKTEEEKYNNLQNIFKSKYAEKSQIYEDITNIKISLSSINEGINSINELTDVLNMNLEETNKNILRREQNKSKIIADNEKYNATIVEYKAKVDALQASISDKTKKLDELKAEKETLADTLIQIDDEIMEKFKNIELLKSESTRLEIKKEKIDNSIEELQNDMWNEYQITISSAMKYDTTNVEPAKAQKELNKLKADVKALGSINVDSIDEYAKVKDRYEFLSTQKKDLEESDVKLRKVISEMINIMKNQFNERFSDIAKNFDITFKELFNGGKANLKLSDADNILESNIEIEAEPPGKKLQSLMSLSGGEKCFTAIALLFAIFKQNPSPFCVLDEIEANLDEANVFKFADYIKHFSNQTQFLVITHRKGTMEIVDTLYGVTMEEKGISKLVSLKMK